MKRKTPPSPSPPPSPKQQDGNDEDEDGLAQQPIETLLQRWELTVGIEIHAELNTRSKLFSAAASSVSDTPNTHTALFDLAFPGSQPTFNQEVVVPAIRSALALNCEIMKKSTFDRKHYFYADQPAGYQITQYYEPFAKDGHVTLYPNDLNPNNPQPIKDYWERRKEEASESDKEVIIPIQRIQLEQDTAKTIVYPDHLIALDFNRVSSPLIEIITHPTIHHPSVAVAYVRKIQTILNSVDALKAGMEFGGLRADVNVSVRRRIPTGEDGKEKGKEESTDEAKPEPKHDQDRPLGQRTEIKNLNSFKAVEQTIVYEMRRQIGVLERGGTVESETRGWAIKQAGSSPATASGTTFRLRGKEGETDYRYMPDPDIEPIHISDELVEHIKSTLPASADDRIEFMTKNEGPYGLKKKDAAAMLGAEEGARLKYFLEVVDRIGMNIGLGGKISDGVYLPPSGVGPNTNTNTDTITTIAVAREACNWTLHQIVSPTTHSMRDFTNWPISVTNLSTILTRLLQCKITSVTAKYLIRQYMDSQGEETRDPDQIIEQEGLGFTSLPVKESVAMAEQVLKKFPDVVKEVVAGIKEESARQAAIDKERQTWDADRSTEREKVEKGERMVWVGQSRFETGVDYFMKGEERIGSGECLISTAHEEAAPLFAEGKDFKSVGKKSIREGKRMRKTGQRILNEALRESVQGPSPAPPRSTSPAGRAKGKVMWLVGQFLRTAGEGKGLDPQVAEKSILTALMAVANEGLVVSGLGEVADPDEVKRMTAGREDFRPGSKPSAGDFDEGVLDELEKGEMDGYDNGYESEEPEW